jgi:hypothetical protein
MPAEHTGLGRLGGAPISQAEAGSRSRVLHVRNKHVNEDDKNSFINSISYA